MNAHTISWILLILQLVALFYVVRNVPIFIVRMGQAIMKSEYTDLSMWSRHPRYFVLVLAIVYLVFVGLPKLG